MGKRVFVGRGSRAVRRRTTARRDRRHRRPAGARRASDRSSRWCTPMKLASYWLDTAPPFAGGARARSRRGPMWWWSAAASPGCRPPSRSPSAARRSSCWRPGRVVGEASGRNGGQCNNGLAHDYASARRDGSGRARATRYYRAYTPRWTRSNGWCARSDRLRLHAHRQASSWPPSPSISRSSPAPTRCCAAEVDPDMRAGPAGAHPRRRSAPTLPRRPAPDHAAPRCTWAGSASALPKRRRAPARASTSMRR